jgi:hypothetical protein
MRFHELREAKPESAIKPLTPDKARKRAGRIEKAKKRIFDITSDNANKLQKARMELADI